ncbi:hypothetical protein E2C01_058117 [Portunus trituberculatus]|uniref:Uncharacterized protein n=1 Tax=Portunus trituberculatus TaxID=210409 RepID=A0A5B7H3U7_PORTR|nr:hypothetical protein [Portunus trituberculatus]
MSPLIAASKCNCNLAINYLHHKQAVAKCPTGYFGADCSQQCIDCIEDKCDSFSGTCTQGCKIGTDCRKGMSIFHGTKKSRMSNCI